MFKRLFYIILLFFTVLGQVEAKSYTEIPTLIHLSYGEQDDTSGFNLVQHLPGFIYKNLQSGKIKLWDSPKKQIQISFQALENIEKSNSVRFSSIENLFLNELWTSSRRKTEFIIVGFSFLAESNKGRISFGYVDLQESFDILGKNNIPCNVNGPAKLSYLEALYSRRYNFNLLQFGSNDFSKSLDQSLRIKKDAFYSKKKVQGLYRIPDTKMVTYSIEKNAGIEGDMGVECIKSIENFLNENKEILFNIGGSKYFDYKNKLFNITITRIEITEVWEKVDGKIVYKPSKIHIYANNKSLNELSFEEVAKWNLLFQFKTLEDVLKEKTFNYQIYKINSDLIPFQDAQFYLKALKDYRWTQVSNYVKYSRN